MWPSQAINPIHKRGIERIYGMDCEEQVLRLLHNQPATAVPVVLERLKKKNDEWVRSRVDCSRTWKKVYVNNFYKALDHRSFYFKQTDKKAIGTKSFVSEITDLPTGATLQHVLPCTADVHADAMEIVKFAMQQEFDNLQAEEIAECLHFWDDIVNGIYEIDAKEAAVEEKQAKEAQAKAKEGGEDATKPMELADKPAADADGATAEAAEAAEEIKAPGSDITRQDSGGAEIAKIVGGDDGGEAEDTAAAAAAGKADAEELEELEELEEDMPPSIYRDTLEHLKNARHKPTALVDIDPYADVRHGFSSARRVLSASKQAKLESSIEGHVAAQTKSFEAHKQAQEARRLLRAKLMAADEAAAAAPDHNAEPAAAADAAEMAVEGGADAGASAKATDAGASAGAGAAAIAAVSVADSGAAAAHEGEDSAAMFGFLHPLSHYRCAPQHGYPLGQGTQSQQTVFYCNESTYIFLRLHQVLCTRLAVARQLAEKKDDDTAQKSSVSALGVIPPTPLLRESPEKAKEGEAKKAYEEFTDILCAAHFLPARLGLFRTTITRLRHTLLRRFPAASILAPLRSLFPACVIRFSEGLHCAPPSVGTGTNG